MKINRNTCPELFVWRDRLQHTWENEAGYRELQTIYGGLYGALNRCPFCSGKWRYLQNAESEMDHICSRCGFAQGTKEGHGVQDHWYDFYAATLKKLSINSSELGLDEIGTHLRRRFSDVYFLNPRRFEELVADVYRHQGYFTRLTAQSRDGGYDVVLLEEATGQQILVECKRYSADRTVGIGTVRELLGVALIEHAPELKLVTTSRFSQAARAVRVDGIKLDLVDADRLFKALEVYNTALPSLQSLGVSR